MLSFKFIPADKQCSKCKEYKALDLYQKHKHTKDKL